jgi:hypothetical protein
MVNNSFAILGSESTCTIRHETIALRTSNFGTKVRLLVLAVYAGFLVALGCIAWDDNIANFDSVHTFADTLNNACCLMTQNAGESTFRIATI